jgi:hypothetical protein
MDFMRFLYALSRDADPSAAGFQPQSLYIVASVALPVTVGLIVGFGLKLIERVFGIELGKGGH